MENYLLLVNDKELHKMLTKSRMGYHNLCNESKPDKTTSQQGNCYARNFVEVEHDFYFNTILHM